MSFMPYHELRKMLGLKMKAVSEAARCNSVELRGLIKGFCVVDWDKQFCLLEQKYSKFFRVNLTSRHGFGKYLFLSQITLPHTKKKNLCNS